MIVEDANHRHHHHHNGDELDHIEGGEQEIEDDEEYINLDDLTDEQKLQYQQLLMMQ